MGWNPPFGWSSSGPRNVAAPFSPADLTSLRGWWKSDTGTTIATGVSQWDDLSGNGNHLVQATGASQPALTAGAINGLPALTFDGVDDNMRAAFALTQPETIFLVFQQTTWSGNDVVFDGTTLNTMLMQQLTASPNLRLFAGTSLTPNTTLPVATWALGTAIFNGASSVEQFNNAAELTGNAGALNGGGITIGARADMALFSNIAVAELIVMAAVATAAERASMKAYVTSRYGIAM